MVRFIWAHLAWLQAEARARVEGQTRAALDGCMIFLHFLLGALVLPVGLDHPAHDEDVGATRVELAVVGESHPELPLGLSHLPVFVEQFVFALVDELRL